MFSGQFTLCYRKEGEKLLNCLSVWLGKKSVPNPNAASNLRTALIKLCGQTSKREFSRWYSYLLSSVQSYPLLHRKTRKQKEKVTTFSATKEKKYPCNKPSKALIWSSSLSRWRTAGLRVGWGNAGLFVHSVSYGAMDWASRFTSVWTPNQTQAGCPASLHTYMRVYMGIHIAEKFYRK